jgi:hypothetical protein
MARLFFTSFIKTLMMTTPFITMVVMVLALWGVGGKTTYIGLDSSNKTQDDALMAKNYLVSGTAANNQEICPTELKNPEKDAEKEKSADINEIELSPVKIDWANTV